MKTTFRRQLALIIAILLAATALIGVSFWALFTRFATSQKEEDLMKTAQTVGRLTKVYVPYLTNNTEYRTNLAVAAEATNSDVVICDTDGDVRICATDLDDCRHLGQGIGRKTAKSVFKEGGKLIPESVGTIYREDRLAYALPIVTEDDTPVCIVLVSVERAELNEITMHTLEILLMVALMVLAVALLAAPYLTHRETKPMQNMVAAVRQIARGNYNVRVPTGNQNREIEELALNFNNMTLALKNSDTVRQEFVANVSHELKTPMTTIAGYLDGMLDGTIPEEKYHYYMGLVSTEARRLSRLVRSMLEISRLREQGIPADRLSDFDICEAAGQTLLYFEQRINRKNLNVEVEMPEVGLRVHAMQDSISQVLQNLIDNAVKFIDEGGTLSIRVAKRGDSAVVTVGNTGPTIPPEELPLVFDRFQKGDKSRSNDRDGTGLGLYIVKTIISAHGEDIFVTSRNGRTEFTFTLSLTR